MFKKTHGLTIVGCILLVVSGLWLSEADAIEAEEFRVAFIELLESQTGKVPGS